MTSVFIDGSAGTTGLRIHERLSARGDISLITLPDEQRKDPAARHDAMKMADISFLCLPDAAAKEAVAMAADTKTRIIDTSTAHRTAEGWCYGFAELGFRDAIRSATRVANPGCHASGFLALVTPLVQCGMLSPTVALTAFSLTGYSGGGKSMIAAYETGDAALCAPRQYALGQTHKHLPEMRKIAGLLTAPVFCPIVSDYYSGMEVTVPLFAKDVKATAAEIRALYRDYYKEGLVFCAGGDDGDGFLSAGAYAGSDRMEILVAGNEERILLISRFDNLGKGASGAAIQNMNIMLGLPDATGLCVTN